MSFKIERINGKLVASYNGLDINQVGNQMYESDCSEWNEIYKMLKTFQETVDFVNKIKSFPSICKDYKERKISYITNYVNKLFLPEKDYSSKTYSETIFKEIVIDGISISIEIGQYSEFYEWEEHGDNSYTWNNVYRYSEYRKYSFPFSYNVKGNGWKANFIRSILKKLELPSKNEEIFSIRRKEIENRKL